MRLFVDSVLAIMLIGVLATLLWFQHHQDDFIDEIAATQHSMQVIESQCLYRAAVGDVPAAGRGFAEKIDPTWFDQRPVNTFFDHEAIPWVEQVADDQHEAWNPSRIVGANRRAAFWYNPFRGVLRARVPMQISQQATVDLYNLVNGTSLRVDDVDWPSPDDAPPARPTKPVKHKTMLTDGKAIASPKDHAAGAPGESATAIVTSSPSASTPSAASAPHPVVHRPAAKGPTNLFAPAGSTAAVP